MKATTMFFTLRLPDDIREKLEALAVKERRSLAGMVIYILEQYLNQKPRK